MRTLQTGFAKQEYSEKKPRGFSHVSAEGGRLRGQYVERFDFVTKVEDPFGKILEVQRIEFEKVTFAFEEEPPVLELTNPPRSLGTFFNSVAQTLSFRVTIQPGKVDLLRWLKTLATHLDGVTVIGATIADIALSNTVSAKVAVSGTSEVRSVMKQFVGKFPSDMLRLQLAGTYRSLPFKCELFNDARATILAGAEEEIAALLRKSLASLQR